MALIRVVVPTYNRAGILPGALDSIVNQTIDRNDVEVVIADDGSTDNTSSVVNDYRNQHSFIRSVSLPHAGVAAARNAAMQLEGEYKYVAFLDADDLWYPQHLEHAIHLLEERSEVALVFGNFETCDYTGTWSSDRFEARKQRMCKVLACAVEQVSQNAYLLTSDRVFRALLTHEFTPCTPTVVVRMAVVGTRTPFDSSMQLLEDCDLFLRLARKDVGMFGFLDSLECTVRYHGDSLTGNTDLSDPVTLSRQRAVLQFRKVTLAMCRLRSDRRLVRRKVRDGAYLVGQCCAEQGDMVAARLAYWESLWFGLSFKAAKGLLACTLPAVVRVQIQAWRRGG